MVAQGSTTWVMDYTPGEGLFWHGLGNEGGLNAWWIETAGAEQIGADVRLALDLDGNGVDETFVFLAGTTVEEVDTSFW